MRLLLTVNILFLSIYSIAQHMEPYAEFSNDRGNGFYQNPILHADYSDPDAIRVGDDYYMISSSFNHSPGLPILHSRDLVNWKLIGHALKKLVPEDHFKTVRHGGGVWAPSIRFHKNEFYIYYPDPDFGIYLIKAKDIGGPWSEPLLVVAGKGLIDPCPLWDDDGKAYLVHAFAGSRAGIKSVIVVKEMSQDGTRILTNGSIVFDGHDTDPTVEGPKFYKRNGYYYIFAPAGGVSTGWQLALRSKSIYGPYERKVVMHQGSTKVNGPHQGAWVDTKNGDNWFIHFQDKEAYGRVVHLQPMKWINDWPVIGEDKDGDGTGEPVSAYTKPIVINKQEIISTTRLDEFLKPVPGVQWQWNANPENAWAFSNNGHLRLYAQNSPDTSFSLWNIPSILLQKFPADEFTFTMKLRPKFLTGDEYFGLVVLGTDYASLSVSGNKENGANSIRYLSRMNADKKEQQESDRNVPVKLPQDIYLQVEVRKGGRCKFSYSIDGKNFNFLKEEFSAKPGKWVGARIGVFALRNSVTNDAGFADIDWIKTEIFSGK